MLRRSEAAGGAAESQPHLQDRNRRRRDHRTPIRRPRPPRLSRQRRARNSISLVGRPRNLRTTRKRSKPDGTPRKLMDVSLLKETGWEPQLTLEQGLAITYEDFQKALESGEYRSQ